MKIAVSATGGSMSAPVEAKFGRAPYYVVVDSETMRFGVVANPNIIAKSGVGPQTAQLISERGAQVVLTGNVGPNAREALNEAGITVVEGVSGKVIDVVNAYLKK